MILKKYCKTINITYNNNLHVLDVSTILLHNILLAHDLLLQFKFYKR
jgi:hypothetical protein